MPGPVDKEQRDGVGFADTPLVDHLKHVAHGVGCGPDTSLGPLTPRHALCATARM
jgi:hypothetical protein